MEFFLQSPTKVARLLLYLSKVVSTVENILRVKAPMNVKMQGLPQDLHVLRY